MVMSSDGWCVQSPAGASGITGDTGATGQTGVTGGWTLLPSNEQVLVLCLGGVIRIQVMGGDVNVCNHLQAQAASRATRVPPVKRVSQVGGHSYHQMNPVLVLCLGDVIGTSDGW